MRDWLARLCLILSALVPAGLVSWLALGDLAAGVVPALALAVLLVLEHRNRMRLLRWLENPEPEEMPHAHGTWEEVFARLYRHFRRERKGQARLTDALVRFREAASAMPDGVIVLDAGGRIEWMNPTAEDHFGLRLRTDRRQAITNLVRHPVLVSYLAARDYGEPLQLRGLGDGERILSVKLVPFGVEQKLLLSRDVTRWERIEAVRRDFIANVSHELRTPVTVMKGFLETLEAAPVRDEKVYRRSLAHMTEQAERMHRLVEDLLKLSQLEDSGYPLREQPVDVPELVNELVEETGALDRRAHAIRAAVGRAGLVGSRDELRSAFSNLLSNAVRYTPPGRDIAVSWVVEDGQPVFRVRDEGEGIAPEHLPRLTERFYRVDRGRSRATGGTGLGLAIVKHVLQRHQGRLAIESEPGRGSTFSCVFPAARRIDSAQPRMDTDERGKLTGT